GPCGRWVSRRGTDVRRRQRARRSQRSWPAWRRLARGCHSLLHLTRAQLEIELPSKGHEVMASAERRLAERHHHGRVRREPLKQLAQHLLDKWRVHLNLADLQ